MKADLKNYTPDNVEYVLDEAVKEQFPLTLDFISLGEDALQGEKPITNKREAMKFVGKHFTSTFPDNELVTRKLDDFEKMNIRDEYCTLQENEVPIRRQELEEAIETAKKMKKDAEEAYASVLMEVSKYAAEVKRGVAEVRLKSTDVFMFALAGYYLIYKWDANKNIFVLAKAYEVPDRSEIWATEEKNRQTMKELFGLEFPEPEPVTEVLSETDNLPFGAD